MNQRIIKIGNSAGIIIPQDVRDAANLKVGDSLHVDVDKENQLILISKKLNKKATSSLTTHFFKVVEKVNKRYSHALKALANK